jgi:hypothetical protein
MVSRTEEYNSHLGMVMTGLADQASKGCTDSPQDKSVPLWLLVGMLVSSLFVQLAQCQEKPAPPATDTSVASHSATAPLIASSVPSGRQALMLRRLWGVDELHVRYTASGSLLRFSYRIVDVDKAKMMNDKKLNPYLIVEKTGAKLEVPMMEKIGQLRQTATPENGREYWMAFGNPGRAVKPGDRVDIVIGSFRATELVVESPVPASRVRKP